MSILSVIQNHFQQRRSITIPVPMAIASQTFDKLSRTDIVSGNKFNPFSNYYTFKVRWDGNTALLEGPFRIKTMPLLTCIVLNGMADKTYTTLDMNMKVSRENIAITLAMSALMNLLFGGIFVYSLFPMILDLILPVVITSLFYWTVLYGLAWLNVIYSSNIIVKCLPLEFSMLSSKY